MYYFFLYYDIDIFSLREVQISVKGKGRYGSKHKFKNV